MATGHVVRTDPLVVLFALLTTLHVRCSLANPVHVVEHEQTLPEVSCLYNNKTYEAGSHFRPDPCTFCHCTKHGGRPRCAVEDCRYEANCVRYAKSAQSECCHECVERGCLHSDGVVYFPEQVVSRTPCSTCVCPHGGGRVECTQVTCPDVSCVDPVMSEGDCCYRCPNGPNCWLGGDIIPAGRMVSVSRCKTCHCPLSRDVSWRFTKGPQAVCAVGQCRQ